MSEGLRHKQQLSIIKKLIYKSKKVKLTSKTALILIYSFPYSAEDSISKTLMFVSDEKNDTRHHTLSFSSCHHVSS